MIERLVYLTVLSLLFVLWVYSHYFYNPEKEALPSKEEIARDFNIDLKPKITPKKTKEKEILNSELKYEEPKRYEFNSPQYENNNLEQESLLATGRFSQMSKENTEEIQEEGVLNVMKLYDQEYYEAAEFEIQKQINDLKDEITMDQYSEFIENLIKNRIDQPDTLKMKDLILFSHTQNALNIRTVFSRLFTATNSRVTEIACIKINYGMEYDNFGISPEIIDWKFLNDKNTGCDF